MNLNSTTCWIVNGTAVCSAGPAAASSFTAGLAVGLSLFLLLLVIVAALAAYTQRARCGNAMLESHGSRGLKKEDDNEDHHHSQRYTMTREQSGGSGQAPIYENFKVQTSGQGRTAIHVNIDPEEDLYLQCDSPDDAIYSNDLAIRLSMLPPVAQDEEDIYIVPDAV